MLERIREMPGGIRLFLLYAFGILFLIGSALRFMLTRLYDWLNTPDGAMVVKKDPLEYVRKMRFHRSVKSAADYGLEG